MKLSTGLRNHLLASGSLKAALDGGEIRIYSGSAPATADDAATGTLLVTLKDSGSGINFASSASGGILSKDAGETWSGTNAATGTAGYYRHVASGDDDSSSGTALRIQGTCGLAGADMNMTSVALTASATTDLDFYTVAAPE